MATTKRSRAGRHKSGRPRPVPAAHLPPRPGALGRALLLIHLVLSPLIFSKKTIEAFEYNKVALLLLIAIALSALALSKLARTPAATPSSDNLSEWLFARTRAVVREPLALGFLLFLSSAVASTLTSISPRTSLFGAHESFAGLETILAYTILFFATRSLCPSFGDARRLLIAPTVAAAVASTYAIIQVAQIDPIRWGRVSQFYQSILVRPFGTMGHANLLSAFLAMAFPITAYFAHVAAKRRQRVVVGVYGLAGALSLIAIAISISRGAWLALACAVAVLLVGWFRIGERRSAAAISALFPLAAVSLVALYIAVPGGSAFIQRIAERVPHLTEVGSRQHLWRASLEMARERPIVGWGLDTFLLAFERKRTVAYWLTEWNGTPTKAHNEALQILATQGLFGATAVLLLTIGLGMAGFLAWRRAEPDRKPFLVAIFAGIVAFYVQVLFSFTVAGCATLFVTFVALVSGMARPHLTRPPPAAASDGLGRFAVGLILADVLAIAILFHNVGQAQTAPRAATNIGHVAAGLAILLAFGLSSASALILERHGQRARPPHALDPISASVKHSRRSGPAFLGFALPVVIWAVALFLMYVAVYLPVRANWAAREGILLINYDARKAVERLERAVATDPTKDLYWAKLGTACQSRAIQTRDPVERRRWLTRAHEAFEESIRLVPANSYNHADLGHLLGELAREGLATPAEVFAAFDKALELDSNNAYFYANAANTALVLGDYGLAKHYASRGAKLYPRFGPTRWELGYTALVEERIEEAASLLQAAVDSDWYGDENGRVIAVSNLTTALARLGRFDEAHKVARAALERTPDSADAHLNLGRALEMLGRRAEAVREYRGLLLRHPDHDRARQALQRLGVPVPETSDMNPSR
jgi:O-antigen ligase/tetratricopeptide (TPR) repeat protein